MDGLLALVGLVGWFYAKSVWEIRKNRRVLPPPKPSAKAQTAPASGMTNLLTPPAPKSATPKAKPVPVAAPLPDQTPQTTASVPVDSAPAGVEAPAAPPSEKSAPPAPKQATPRKKTAPPPASATPGEPPVSETAPAMIADLPESPAPAAKRATSRSKTVAKETPQTADQAADAKPASAPTKQPTTAKVKPATKTDDASPIPTVATKLKRAATPAVDESDPTSALRYPRCQGLKLPALPEALDQTITSTTRTNPPQELTINPYHLTCSCDNHRAHLAKLPKGDIRRVCSHLLAQLRRLKALEQLDPMTLAIVTSRTPWSNSCAVKVRNWKGEALLGYDPGEVEAVVFVREQGNGEASFNRYRFHLLQGKWLGNRIPVEGEVLADKIKAQFQQA